MIGKPGALKQLRTESNNHHTVATTIGAGALTQLPLM